MNEDKMSVVLWPEPVWTGKCHAVNAVETINASEMALVVWVDALTVKQN